MNYQHRFQVKAPLDAVVEFHAHSNSMGAITPPPVRVKVHQAPPRLSDGDIMDFTLWLGPLPLHWMARIENITPDGFTDRQVRGPFRQWVHRHTFVPIDETTTEVVDRIEFKLKPHPFWALIGLGMGLTLPLLFAYRGWKTRRILEKHPQPARLARGQ